MVKLYAFVQPTCSKCQEGDEGFLHGRRCKNAAAKTAKVVKKAERGQKRAAGAREAEGANS